MKAWNRISSPGEAGLLNGWMNFGPAGAEAGYVLVEDMVVLKGLVRGGSLGQPVFVLPEGVRPAEPVHLLTASGAANFNSITPGLLRITAAGEVIPLFGATGFFALDSARFRPA